MLTSDRGYPFRLASLVTLAYDPPSWHPRTLLRLAAVFSEVEGWEALYTWRQGAIEFSL